MKVLISRRLFVQGPAGTVIVGTSVPMPAPVATKTVSVVCETTYRGRQWVVFDDLPTTIFAYKVEPMFSPFVPGQEYLVAVNEPAYAA